MESLFQTIYQRNLGEQIDTWKNRKPVSTLRSNLVVKRKVKILEDEKTEIELINMGCDIGQGYFYSKPLPSSEIFTFFHQNI
ncbi:MAG: hypothetical protein K9N07_08185 [Candidatus Cloacimonetes bacterium]|nr:hypothetical protein [Candidatus Cloacimonadota bacterium]